MGLTGARLVGGSGGSDVLTEFGSGGVAERPKNDPLHHRIQLIQRQRHFRTGVGGGRGFVGGLSGGGVGSAKGGELEGEGLEFGIPGLGGRGEGLHEGIVPLFTSHELGPGLFGLGGGLNDEIETNECGDEESHQSSRLRPLFPSATSATQSSTTSSTSWPCILQNFIPLRVARVGRVVLVLLLVLLLLLRLGRGLGVLGGGSGRVGRCGRCGRCGRGFVNGVGRQKPPGPSTAHQTNPPLSPCMWYSKV